MNIKKNALLLPLATFPFSAEAITITVPSGTTESNGEVIAVVTQQVYGETDNFKVYGTQQVMNGGLTHDSDIYSYAQQDVLSGGTAYDTNVQYYAIQNINGKAYNSTVSSRGNINLRKGGYAENTMINGGTLSVAAGGEASGTKLQSGAENVSGTDINAQISGGIQEIKSGGLAEGAQVSGRGNQKVDAGGRAQNAVLTGRGTQQVYGTAIKTQINDDASMTVYDGGHAEQTVINGGEMEVEEEASTVKTTINAGTQYVYGTDSNSIINGGEQNIAGGGKAINTQINSGGKQTVDIGGSTEGSEVAAGGTMQVLSWGSAANTLLNGGEMIVAAGAESSGTRIDAGTQTVAGTDSDAVINGGTQNVQSGGRSENATLNGGTQNIESGALANATKIINGTQNVYGTSENAQLSGGKMEIFQGGSAANTLLNGGEMIVAAGAESSGTRINAGTQIVAGTDSNALINGGTQNVQSGGHSENATLNGGTQNIESGASANGTKINNGTQNVYGTSENAQLSGGKMEIFQGGSAANTLLNGGEMVVAAGAESSGTRIDAGTQIVAGTDSNAVINGGTQNVQSGGHSKNATLNGGTQNIESGASANATKIINGTQNVYGTSENARISGGKMEIFQGGSATNVDISDGLLVLNSGGILNGTTQISQGAMTFQGQQNISDLQLDDAVVNFARGTDFSTLQVDNLNGRGVFNMSSDLSRNEADYLEVANGSGDFGLIIHDYSADGGLPVKFSIIESAAADNNFYLVGDAVDVGAFQYGLQQEGNSWYLTKMQNLTESSIIAKNTYNSLASLFYTHINPVYQHLYSTRRDVSMENKLWVKGIGRHLNLDYDDNSGSKVDIYGIEAGYDHNLWSNGTNTLKAGIFASYSNSRQEYDMHGHGDGNTNGLGIYSTFNFGDNWFVDAVGSYFYHRQKIKSYTPSGFDVDSKYHAEGWHASAFIGKRLNFEQNWFIEPNAGIRYMLIDNISYRTNYNTRVTASASDYFSVSAGITGGKEFQLENQGILDIYGRFNLIHDRDGKSVLQVADYSFTEDMSALQYELGGGVSFSWDEGKNAAYLDAVTLLGSTVRVPVEVQLGLRFGF